MFLEIISPQKKIFSGEVKQVLVPGSKGQFEILRNHAPIVSTLAAGKIKIVSLDGEKTFFDIKSGVIDLKDNNIIILVDSI